MNKVKTKFVTDKGDWKDVTEVRGIERVTSYKYLGIEVTLTKA